jgi:hypothetical protein
LLAVATNKNLLHTPRKEQERYRACLYGSRHSTLSDTAW